MRWAATRMTSALRWAAMTMTSALRWAPMRMTSALRWAAMRAVQVNVSLTVREKVTRECPQAVFEEKGKPKQNRADRVLVLTILNRLTIYTASSEGFILFWADFLSMTKPLLMTESYPSVTITPAV